MQHNHREFSKAYRVIRINLPGHGASPAPTSRGYCLEDFVEDVARVFRELSIEKAVLIGLSMGGIVAQKFALKYSHFVMGLVLVDTTAHGIGPDATADAFLAIADKRGLKKAPGLVGQVIQFLDLAGASRMGAT